MERLLSVKLYFEVKKVIINSKLYIKNSFVGVSDLAVIIIPCFLKIQFLLLLQFSINKYHLNFHLR